MTVTNCPSQWFFFLIRKKKKICCNFLNATRPKIILIYHAKPSIGLRLIHFIHSTKQHWQSNRYYLSFIDFSKVAILLSEMNFMQNTFYLTFTTVVSDIEATKRASECFIVSFGCEAIKLTNLSR